MFSINTLINIYNLIEFICWNQFKENLNNQYQLHLKDDVKKDIKEYLDNAINENNFIKKQDIANAVRRLISRYLSGKRGDSDISEYKKLFDYIQRADLWKADIPDNENFFTELYTIFDGMKNISRVDIECNEEDNKCEDCSQMRLEGNQNPCKDCNDCKFGLRIGHALEFYELINEEVFNVNKYNEKGDNSDDEELINMKSTIVSKEFEINTNSKKENEDEENDENRNEENKEEEEENEEQQEQNEEEQEELDEGEI